jgi:hypothetical protein
LVAGQGSIAAFTRIRVLSLDQQPIVSFRITAPASLHAHKMPTTFQPLAMELEVETPFLVAARRITYRRPSSLIPKHHRAAAIFALRNRAFEGAVGEGMILDMNGEPLVRRIEARVARHCPAFKRTIHSEPKIVMKPARRMLLDEIGMAR